MPNRRQVRWIQKLVEYDFVIEYRPDTSNPARGPSRRPDHKPREDKVVEQLLPTLRTKLQGVYMTHGAVFTGEERRILTMQPLRAAREALGRLEETHRGRFQDGRRTILG
jgi:hypothetical protein